MLEVSLYFRNTLFFLLKHCTRKKRCETGSAHAQKREFRTFHAASLRKQNSFIAVKYHEQLSHCGW